jgi:hypothetical protein
MSSPGNPSPGNALPGNWHQVARGVTLPFDPGLVVPELVEVELPAPELPPVTDVRAAAEAAVRARLGEAIGPGTTVAVGAGSRGLTGRVELIAGAVAGVRALGGEPFVVPAMGSHGGGTAEGQRDVLEGYGITEAAVGAEIRCTMDTVEVARTDDGMPLFFDRHAAAADRILPVNRVKPHTCFVGPIESGLTKMAVVGFGKQPGAAQIHSCGPVEMRDRLLAGIEALRATGRLAGGVASVEDGTGAVVRVEGLDAVDVGGPAERRLSDLAKGLVPPLPFAEIDVLVVEQVGKDISGVGIDPNVTGRYRIHGLADADRPRVATVVALGLTPDSHGNAMGLGLVDFVPASLANLVDWDAFWFNAFTAGPAGVQRAKMPMVLPDADAAVRAAVSMCGRAVGEVPRMVRIRSTLHLTRIAVSEPLLAELPPGARPHR